MKNFNYLAIVLMALLFAGCPEDPNFPNTPNEPNNPEEPNLSSAGFTAKPFSVSASKQIVFSSGNLQYHYKNDEWRFAENQTDYVGYSNDDIAADYYDGWIDLFGWGTGNNPTNTSEEPNDYQEFDDWGINQIGNYDPNTWRTLTYDEWYYLLHTRDNADNLICIAQVNDVNGLILLPDGWECPVDMSIQMGVCDDITQTYAEHQTFTAEQWAKIEKTGAVFLPAAGFRWGKEVRYVQENAGYWSSTRSEDDNDEAWSFEFYETRAVLGLGYRLEGHSVRLVKDISGFVAKPFSVSSSKQVHFSSGNLQYCSGFEEWRFALNQTECIGTDNRYIDADYYEWIDLFGWGTGDNPTNSSENPNDYQKFVDWGINKINNYKPNTWRTLTSNEWIYLISNRTNADNLISIAQVNGVNGLVLLPDNWKCPENINFKTGFYSDYGTEYYAIYQALTLEQWSMIEVTGAVFLPAAGSRFGLDVGATQFGGLYWSATKYDDNLAEVFAFLPHMAAMDHSERSYGHSVRLVQDVK